MCCCATSTAATIAANTLSMVSSPLICKAAGTLTQELCVTQIRLAVHRDCCTAHLHLLSLIVANDCSRQGGCVRGGRLDVQHSARKRAPCRSSIQLKRLAPASTLAWYVRSRFRTLSSVSSLRWTWVCVSEEGWGIALGGSEVRTRQPKRAAAHQPAHNPGGRGLEGEVVDLARLGVAAK